MPSWTQNTIYAKNALLRKYINGKGEFDFNILFPIPCETRITGSLIQKKAIFAYLTNKTFDISQVSRENREYLYDLIYPTHQVKDWSNLIHSPHTKEQLDDLYCLGDVYFHNIMREDYDIQAWKENFWSTFSNASFTHLGNNQVSFRTSWSMPLRIFEELCEQNPFAEIEITSYVEATDRFYRFSNDSGILRVEGIYDDYLYSLS